MKTVCLPEDCTGCGACTSVCNNHAIEIRDCIDTFSPIIIENMCINCGKCAKVCPNHSYPNSRKYYSAYQGWSENPSIRKNASSGGIASALMYSFISNGGYICSCRADNSGYNYTITNRIEDINKYCGSKYVKSDATESYTNVLMLLKRGESVLFIGLPCHVAGLLNVIDKKFQEKLYTIDLVCHGAPSIKLLYSYFRINKKDFLDEIAFRDKTQFGLYVSGKKITPKVSYDEYTYSFLKGLTYYKSCYNCKSAKLERISDITLGDAWGSEIDDQVDAGISLILCQTSKGKQLLDSAAIVLNPIDIDTAIKFNKQLNAPSECNSLRNRFFYIFKLTGSFQYAFTLCYPLFSIKSAAKKALNRLGMYGN